MVHNTGWRAILVSGSKKMSRCYSVRGLREGANSFVFFHAVCEGGTFRLAPEARKGAQAGAFTIFWRQRQGRARV